MSGEFSETQKDYLEGLGRGLAVARGVVSAGTSAPGGPDRIHVLAQDRAVASGGKLTREEEAKRAKHPFDMWDEIAATARSLCASMMPLGLRSRSMKEF